ncbi:hypothetical protein K435DRAFT_787429 [Dendrothele bispora CBS 962.96]|uniref:lytic cellulose monooxygenase (C4-dehydrogenating) n=1 Tax=Dendrothele bispora (strain CBS 962.96) TaxID=1314807 RepID=A0A4S8KKB4_DENBC|nr:hypothetical protein K435DRAFT_787429 [Dendrothele bispora CBS 962.96]
MTITFFLNLFLHLFLATGVSAHGFVSQVSIAGKVYTGNLPGGTANPSIVRQVSDIGPVKGADNPDLFCGLGSKVASDVADANPGDTIGVKWVGGSTGQGNWIHNVGPMFTYMASCGDTPCNEYTSTDAKWFKIEQIARTSDGGPWAQAALTDPSTNVVNIQLPSTLEPGNYLFRHEVLSLQNGVAMGGAEFYPSCTQLKVGGSGTGGPENDELVSLPGAYHDDDPGIYDPNVYDPSAPYTFPGPPVAKFAADGSSSSGSSGSSGGSSSGSSSNSGGSSGGSGSSVSNQGDSVLASQTCRLRKSEIDTTSLFSLQHVVQNRRHSKRRLANVMRSLLPNTWNPS